MGGLFSAPSRPAPAPAPAPVKLSDAEVQAKAEEARRKKARAVGREKTIGFFSSNNAQANTAQKSLLGS